MAKLLKKKNEEAVSLDEILISVLIHHKIKHQFFAFQKQSTKIFEAGTIA